MISPRIPESKSMFLRALLMQSYNPEIRIMGESDCDDVLYMSKALQSLKNRGPIFCGEAGAVIRFMGLRASRESGEFHLFGSKKLLERPQLEISQILEQLNVSCQVSKEQISISGLGWCRPAKDLVVSMEESSQFLSALLLNAWGLPFDLRIKIKGDLSVGYLQMTMDMLRQQGMTVLEEKSSILVPAFQVAHSRVVVLEKDLGCVFALMVDGILNGDRNIEYSILNSIQPDSSGFRVLQQTGAFFEFRDKELHVGKSRKILPVDVSLKNSPDLFPVLAVLLAFAEGTSTLMETPQLKNKESNRIAKTAELLNLAGVECFPKGDGIVIHGKGQGIVSRTFDFDADKDHRMAMAAGILINKGMRIGLKSADSVSKSFPDFWKFMKSKVTFSVKHHDFVKMDL